MREDFHLYNIKLLRFLKMNFKMVKLLFYRLFLYFLYFWKSRILFLKDKYYLHFCIQYISIIYLLSQSFLIQFSQIFFLSFFFFFLQIFYRHICHTLKVPSLNKSIFLSSYFPLRIFMQLSNLMCANF